jgi:penicillin-binding protein 1A
MREIHLGLPLKDFVRPAVGLVDATVCAQTGLLKTSACPGDVTLTYLEGTQPTTYCDVHGNSPVTIIASSSLEFGVTGIDDRAILQDLKMPELDLDFLPSSGNQTREQSRTNVPRNQRVQRNQDSFQNRGGYGLEMPNYNPLLD